MKKRKRQTLNWIFEALILLFMLGVALWVRETEAKLDHVDDQIQAIVEQTNRALYQRKNEIEAVQLVSESYEKMNQNRNRNIADRLDTLETLLDKVAEDEKEIRSYYVNFREPKEENSGVTWSSYYKCNDDQLTEMLDLTEGLEFKE